MSILWNIILDIRMLKHDKVLVIRGLSSIPFSSINSSRCKWYSQFAFYQQQFLSVWPQWEKWQQKHAPREQRQQADLWCAGDGAASDICSHELWPGRVRAGGTQHQQPSATARSWQGRFPEPLPQWGCWAELLGSCGPGFWLTPEGAEVSIKQFCFVNVEFTNIGFPWA